MKLVPVAALILLFGCASAPAVKDAARIELSEDVAGHLLRTQHLTAGTSGKIRIETHNYFEPTSFNEKTDSVDPRDVAALATELLQRCSGLPGRVPLSEFISLDAPYQRITVFTDGKKLQVEWYPAGEGADTQEVRQFQAAWALATKTLRWPPLPPP